MEKTLIAKSNILIDASQSKVWDILVNPEHTKGYMYGCEIVTDFTPGSKVDWRANVEGKAVVFVTGVLIDYQPEEVLAYTTFDPNSDMEDVPENHVTVTCRLSESGGMTQLHVTQGDFATVADGEARYADTVKGGGWDNILQAIKRQAEA